MQNKFPPAYGISLMISSIVMLLTMVLHPAGGSIEHLQRITSVIIITHAMALLSMPFALLGFWGLTKKLDDGNILSVAAFITMTLGIFAVMCAAATNGLALPLFLHHYLGAPPEKLSSIKPVLAYNSSLNHAFDYIYITAACGSVFLWSLVILKTSLLPKWLGRMGIILAVVALVSMIAGFVFVDLAGFRVFVFGFVAWTIVTGNLLRRSE